MDEDTKLKKVYEEAYNFLKNKVDESVLKKQLEYYHTYKPNSIKDVFKQMVCSLKDRQGYVNFIADINQMDSILLGFEPKILLIKPISSPLKKYHSDQSTCSTSSPLARELLSCFPRY